MKQTSRVVFALVILTVLIVPQYARATVYDEVVQDLNFAPVGEADEVQNNLDDGSTTNYDTWDPVPSGVWFGGWPVESLLRLSDVPDTEFQVAYATVCRFGADIIMSGASRTLVRLPVHTGDWTSARLNVYRISAGTNWTFSYNADVAGAFGEALDHLRINFTDGVHELLFYSDAYDPSDLSPTDYDDHFTRANRTYVFVDAPIVPGSLYLFVTYVWYPSDSYVETYIQPDSLDSEGVWNRSTIAVYNSEAPDTFTLDVDNFNASCGYSFDFRNGFGNGAYGLNIWMEEGDDIDFWSYIPPATIPDASYMTFMLPYRSTVDNLSWEVSIQHFEPMTGSVTELGSWGAGAADYICRDFILLSMEQTWSTNYTAKGVTPSGWFRISCEVGNDTRLWLPLWDLPSATGSGRMNHSWGGSVVGGIWDSDSEPTYNLMQYVEHDLDAGGTYAYHFMVQHSLQFNNYIWQKTTPPGIGTESVDATDNMTLTSKVVYGIGSVFLRVGDWLAPISFTAGLAARAIGVSSWVIAQANVIPDFVGWAWDRLKAIGEFFEGVGQWIWRAAQSVVGAIRWFVETVAYFASIILGLLLVVLAIAIPLTIGWFAMKMGLTAVALIRGRGPEATGHVSDMVGLAGKLRPRG